MFCSYAKYILIFVYKAHLEEKKVSNVYQVIALKICVRGYGPMPDK